ncbi:hypothetical protein DSM25558_0150 [Agrobacterium sp. DSM 25558]|nr:hypothetical protein DSM25558_0150 [Agrobacterium sp. DSM 25558]
MITTHDVVASLFLAGMYSGAFLLNRFLFPSRFIWIFPTWKSSYIVAALMFVTIFVLLLFE